MKKFFSALLLAALGVFAFTSCEDVPAPFANPNDKGNDKADVVVEPAGDGSATNPFNVAAAVAKCKEIGTTESSEKYYVKGIIKSISLHFDESSVNSYGNATFDMIDDGNKSVVFKAFQVYYLNNEKCFVPNTLKVGDEVIVYGPIYNYSDNTPETVGKGAAYIYQHNGKTEGGDTPTPTEATKVTIAEAIEICNALADAGKTTENYELTDVTVAEIYTADDKVAQYGNINLLVKDATGASIKAYYTNNIGNQKFTSANDIPAVGATVTIVGPLKKYVKDGVASPEVENGWFTAISKTKGQGGDNPPVVDQFANTEATALTVAEAIAKCKEAGTTATTEKYYVKGIVSKLDTKYANTFWISADGSNSNELEFYNGVGINGATINQGDIAVGDEVVVVGQLVNYNNSTLELTKGCQLVSIKKGEGGNITPTPTPDPEPADPNTIVCANLGLADQAAVGTLTYNGVTFVCADGGNSNPPKYFNGGKNIRMYPKNTMTLTAEKTIKSITLNCDTYNGTICVAEGNVTATPGTVTTTGATITISGINSTSVTITNAHAGSGTASQIRILSLEFEY